MSLYSFLNRSQSNETLPQSALWSLFGTLVYTGCQWGILATTVRLTNPSDVGLLSLGFAISAPIFLFLQLRLRSASATDFHRDFEVADYVTLRLLCTFLAFALTFVVCLACRFSSYQVWIVMLIAAAKALESGSDLLYGFSQRANDMRIISLSMIGRGLLSLSCFVLLVLYTRSIVIGLGGLCFGWGVVLLLIDLPYTVSLLHSEGREVFGIRWRPAAMKVLSMATLPLGISTLLMSFSASLPRYFIERFLGPSELGIFSAIGYLAMVISVIVTALAESGIARMAQFLSGGDFPSARGLLRTILWATGALSVAGVIASVAFGGRLITLLYGRTYASAEDLLTWMMVASAIANLASVYGFALIAGKDYRSYLQALAGLTVVMTISSALLIPRWGTRGAVFACIAAYAIQLAASYLKTRSMLTPLSNPLSSRTVPAES
jgi:O-antigen/teichoic acid export membrane protein